MKTFIVLIPVNDYDNGKTVAENIQGKTFKKGTLRDKVMFKLKSSEGEEDNGISILTLADFMSYCNENDGMLNEWVASVNVEE
jgi:hypothetical protein